MICEGAAEVQEDIHMFYRLHKELIETFHELDLDGREVRLLRNCYSEQIAGLRIEDKIQQRSTARLCTITRPV